MRQPSLRLIGSGGRRRRVSAALALGLAVAVVAVVVLRSGSSPSRSTNGSSGQVSGAVAVERRDLVETDTESGTLSYSDPQTVYDRLSGTITSLPNVGQVIKPGGTLFTVDREPVVLMNGSTPAYRDLTPADSSGADILELNRNLVALGFNADGVTVNDTWQPGTTVGVEQFQASLGETSTGTLALGQVVFLPADQLISTVETTLGSAGGGSGSSASPGASATSDPVLVPRSEFVSLEPKTGTTSTTTATVTTTTTAPAPRRPTRGGGGTPGKPPSPSGPSGPSGPGDAQTLGALIALLKAEISQLKAAERHSPRSPSKSSNGSGSGSGNKSGSGSTDGGSGATPQAILQTTSTRLVVTVDLNATSQSEAAVGEHVTVEMPAGNTLDGTITAVSPVAQNSSGSGGSNGSGSGGGTGGGGNQGNGSGASTSTIPVTITLDGHHVGRGLDQAAVSVNFAQQRANHVLSVPVTALLATGGGNYAVQEANAPHRLIPVTPGLFAAGYVQVSGEDLYPGLEVTDSQG